MKQKAPPFHAFPPCCHGSKGVAFSAPFVNMRHAIPTGAEGPPRLAMSLWRRLLTLLTTMVPLYSNLWKENGVM
ncbi:hypothetical protein LIER_27846 [Lithospermum erythrorhizon]|uniref:Uncharacterized protein n=1 Tax=Lithospermum erythrorhizon TaxID=34254 RepID=A0AAV3RF71_LITER